MLKRFLVLICMSFFPFGAVAGEVSGTAAYRERIALPADAIFRAVLFDISNNGQVEIGRFDASATDGPPYAFTIAYPQNAVSSDGQYAIRSEVIWPDRPFFAAAAILADFPKNPDPEIDLVMMRVGAATTGQGDPAGEGEKAENAVRPAHGLTLPATYLGTVKTGETEVDWHLNMAADQTFQLSRTFHGGDGEPVTRSSIGRWQADPTPGAIILHDGAEMPLMIRPAPQGRARVVDVNSGQPLDGDLKTDGSLQPLDLDQLLIGGMMIYMADAAIIEECTTGTVFPIATEGDYLALESAYLADRAEPGAPLYVMIEGGIAMLEGMEGPARQTVVVNKFIRTRPGVSCERQKADAGLRNTFWRLDQLDGTAVSADGAKQEPHLLLETGETGGYRATVGCNLMRGRVQVDEASVSFSAAASTMMACPAPLDELERQLGQTLSEVSSFDIVGDSLVFSDDTGAARAVFTAVYF